MATLVIFFVILISIFAVLSATGTALILAYLWTTERKAPSIFSEKSKDESVVTIRDDLPLISIVITAKNEEVVIERCISSLQKQTYQNLEIIVVDDNSADGTLEIAEKLALQDSRIRVIESGPKPSGWLGKSWPCQRGFEVSRGENLLFVDADSSFDPRAIDLTWHRFENAGLDMYSISPTIQLKGIWAHAVMPVLAGTINLLYPMIKVNEPSSKRAYVFGTFVLVRRSVYEEIGGHERVKDTLVEDAAIAQVAKSTGHKLRVERGNGLVETEWEEGFSTIYQGLERIFSDSIKSYGRVSVLNAILIFFLGLYSLGFIAGYLYLVLISATNHSTLLILTVGFVASMTSVVLTLLIASLELQNLTDRIGLFPLLYPLGFFLFMCAIITTSRKVFSSKPLSWKGEKYSELGAKAAVKH